MALAEGRGVPSICQEVLGCHCLLERAWGALLLPGKAGIPSHAGDGARFFFPSTRTSCDSTHCWNRSMVPSICKEGLGSLLLLERVRGSLPPPRGAGVLSPADGGTGSLSSNSMGWCPDTLWSGSRVPSVHLKGMKSRSSLEKAGSPLFLPAGIGVVPFTGEGAAVTCLQQKEQESFPPLKVARGSSPVPVAVRVQPPLEWAQDPFSLSGTAESPCLSGMGVGTPASARRGWGPSFYWDGRKVPSLCQKRLMSRPLLY